MEGLAEMQNRKDRICLFCGELKDPKGAKT
jgi:hypothetical protein